MKRTGTKPVTAGVIMMLAITGAALSGGMTSQTVYAADAATSGTTTGEIRISPEGSSYEISWDEVSGADSYIVYQKEYGGDWNRLVPEEAEEGYDEEYYTETSYSSPDDLESICEYKVVAVSGGNTVATMVSDMFCTRNGALCVYDGDTLTITGTGVLNYDEEDFRDSGYDDSFVKKVVIGEGFTEIADASFMGSGMESLTLPAGLTSIDSEAFEYCSKLKEVNIPASVTDIGGYAFSECTALVKLTIKGSDATVGVHAFSGCTSLKSVSIASGVKVLAQGAFSGCTALSDVQLNEGLETIEGDVFAGCTGLKTISIPKSVSDISTYTFNMSESNYNHLPVTIYGRIGSAAEKFAGLEGFAFVNTMAGVKNPTVAYSGNCGASGSSSVRWTLYEDGSMVISGKGAMMDYPTDWKHYYSITKVTVKDGITGIGNGAFGGLVNLSEVILPDTLKTIGDSTFASTAIGKLLIPDSVTDIGMCAFNGCKNLKNITLPADLKCIDTSTFWGCSSLKEITVPGSVESIGYSAFNSCTGLTKVVLEDGVETIGAGAFLGCTSLETLILPNSVSYIEGSAFVGCNSLKKVTFPTGGMSYHGLSWKVANGVMTISGKECVGKYGAPWRDLDCITEVVIENGITGIEYAAFAGCEGITKITIPKSVTSIDKDAFNKCEVTTSKLEDTTETGCTNLKYIYGYKGSAAEKFASSNKYTFKVLVDADKQVTLSAPTVKSANVVSGIKVTWSKVKNAAGYIVYRKISGTKTWTKLTKLTKNTKFTYTDKKAKAGKKYVYTVKAYKGSVLSSGKTSTALVRIGAVKTVKASVQVSGVKVTWTKASGAKGYIVYRKAKGSKTWTKLTTVKSAKKFAYTDKKTVSGKVYTYKVKAYNGKSYSTEKTGSAIRYLKAPAKVTATKKTTGIRVTWTKTTGAKGYIVYRKAKGSKTWTRIATVKSAKKFAYSDKKAKKGKTYTYGVKAYYGKSYSALRTGKSVKR